MGNHKLPISFDEEIEVMSSEGGTKEEYPVMSGQSRYSEPWRCLNREGALLTKGWRAGRMGREAFKEKNRHPTPQISNNNK